MYQMIRGLHDRDQMERVLQAAAQVEGGELTLTRVIKLLEALEMGKTSQKLVDSNGSTLNRMSQHRKNNDNSRQQNRDSRGKNTNNKDTNKAKQDGCSNCGSKNYSSKLADRKKHCEAFQEICAGCGVVGHYKKLCRGGGKSARSKSRDKKQPAKPGSKVAVVSEETPASDTPDQDTASLGQLSANCFLISASPSTKQLRFNFDEIDSEQPWRASSSVSKQTQLNTISNASSRIPHMVCTPSGAWRKQNVEPHARIEVQLSPCVSSYKQLNLQQPPRHSSVRVIALADTGAQMCVADLATIEMMGIRRQLLPQPVLNVSVANNEDLTIVGVAFLTITSPTGSAANQMVYLAQHVGEFYLSKSACRDLGIIDANFPALHPPTSSSELGNQGGSFSKSGGFQLLTDNAISIDDLPHVLYPATAQGDQMANQDSPAQQRLGAHDGHRIQKPPYINAQLRLDATQRQDIVISNVTPQVPQPSTSVSTHLRVDCQDVGPDYQHEFPNISSMQHGDWPHLGSNHAQKRAASSTPTHNQVHGHDSLGRPLAPCGCLLRTAPPPIPTAPPFMITEQNTEQVRQ